MDEWRVVVDGDGEASDTDAWESDDHGSPALAAVSVTLDSHGRGVFGGHWRGDGKKDKDGKGQG